MVGRAPNGEEATRLAAETKPHVDPDGHQHAGRWTASTAAEQIVRDAARDVGALPHRLELAGRRRRGARSAGGSGYVTKDRIASELVDAILATAA